MTSALLQLPQQDSASKLEAFEQRLRALEQRIGLPVLAVNQVQAAKMLGVCRDTVRKLSSRDDSDPRKIRKTAYGTYAITELQRHLNEELKR